MSEIRPGLSASKSRPHTGPRVESQAPNTHSIECISKIKNSTLTDPLFVLNDLTYLKTTDK